MTQVGTALTVEAADRHRRKHEKGGVQLAPEASRAPVDQIPRRAVDSAGADHDWVALEIAAWPDGSERKGR